MENTPLINDLVIMLSAVGSALAGAFCGWQLRRANEPRQPKVDTTNYDSDGSMEACETLVPDEFVPDNATATVVNTDSSAHASHNSLSDAVVSPPDKSLSETSVNSQQFLDHLDPLSSVYGEQPQGLSESEVREVAERLSQMADRIIEDVDAHDAQLHEVNDSLNLDTSVPTMESIMSAVKRLLTANEAMQAQLRDSRDRIVEQAQQIESAESRANTDALTRVSNRRAFDRELANWDKENPGVLALIDIDHFKKFNDEHGHPAGDEVLRQVASALRSRLEDHCMVARYGGEEFGLVFTNDRLEDVLDLIESARRSISEEEFPYEDKLFHVTCSLGVTRMLADEPSAACLQRADDGLYMAKREGRDCGYCIDSVVVGQREKPVRLGQGLQPGAAQETVSNSRQISNQALLDRIPNRESLADSYCELLQRLGKAPVKLSVIAISVSDPETMLNTSSGVDPVTRFTQLYDVSKTFCRAVDRIGYVDSQTLLLCLPGADRDDIANRVAELRTIAAKQLQVEPSAISIGASSITIGDTFDGMVTRAIHGA